MFHKPGDEDTICALSTPSGVGGIAVIRISGLKALQISRKLCPFLPKKAESHRIYYGICCSLGSDGENPGESLDEVLVSYFADGRSFTGEETIEISCHGGQVITATLLKELVKAGCRMATRGEFTYRAFMNGRLDLVQAESVLSLIESQSRQSAKVALRQLQGHLSNEFQRIESDLLWILAHLEASIDFSTEGIEVVSTSVLVERTEGLIGFLDRLLESYNQGRVIRDGLQVALVGRPNAGKSSLLNAVLKEDRAIVTAHAGTTRDTVEGRISVAGIPVTFVDTAGLRETNDEIEKAGIERSRAAMKKSDFIFCVVDLGSADWRAELAEVFDPSKKDADEGSEKAAERYYIFNKMDLDRSGELRAEARAELERRGVLERGFFVSALTHEGLSLIESLVSDRVKMFSSESSNVVTQGRHFELLQKIRTCLSTAIELMRVDSSPEFIAFELQESIRAVHELLGKEFHEQVIDRIFKEFCLGK